MRKRRKNDEVKELMGLALFFLLIKTVLGTNYDSKFDELRKRYEELNKRYLLTQNVKQTADMMFNTSLYYKNDPLNDYQTHIFDMGHLYDEILDNIRWFRSKSIGAQSDILIEMNDWLTENLFIGNVIDHEMHRAFHPANGLFTTLQSYQESVELTDDQKQILCEKTASMLFKKKTEINDLLVEYVELNTQAERQMYVDLLLKNVDLKTDVTAFLHGLRMGEIKKNEYNLSKLRNQVIKYGENLESIYQYGKRRAAHLERVTSFVNRHLQKLPDTILLTCHPELGNLGKFVMDRRELLVQPDELTYKISDLNPIGNVLYKQDRLRLESWLLHQRLPYQ